jgi:hypothetical protein
LTEKSSPVETQVPSGEQQGDFEEKKAPQVSATTKEGTIPKAIPGEDPCALIEKKVAEFFLYLDSQKYVQQMDLETDTHTRFKEILKRLSAKTPMPAGGGIDPEIIIRNICHFFRVLNSKDLRLIRETIRNEQDSLEIELEMFYKWLMQGDSCYDPEGQRPSLEVLYKYAGFFINSTGGRAYLFRRPSTVRLLVTYYCVLIIHEADKAGKNKYGIDVSPTLAYLTQEISRYPDFKFHQYYIDRLNLIESYYVLKRSQD